LPFTLSHAAAVIPLAQSRLVFSALVVGSMSPDFGYFIFQTTTFRFGHTLPGVLLFCVPVSLAMLWLLHSVLKYPLISLLPEAHRKRLLTATRAFRFGPLSRFIVIVLSIVLGAVTHLVWDAFTHEEEWGAQYLAFLRQPIWQSAAPDPLKLCDVLQHASTILGTVFLVFWYLRWLRQRPAIVPDSTTKLPVQLSVKAQKQLLLTFAVATPILAVAFNYNTKLLFHSYGSFQTFLRLTVLLSVPLLLMQLCLYSVIWHLIASQQFSYNGETSVPRASGSKPGGSSGEYALRFSGDTQSPLADAQHPLTQQRSSGEYSIKGPR
jgi:hypothetical protein